MLNEIPQWTSRPPIRQLSAPETAGSCSGAGTPDRAGGRPHRRRARDRRRSTALACSIRRITTPLLPRRSGHASSSSSVTTAYAASTPRHTSGVTDSAISTTCSGGIDAWSLLVDAVRAAVLAHADAAAGSWNDIPLLIDFAASTSLLREQHRISALPIIGNGPPGTFVLFPSGLRVSLPTDQIVFADDTHGRARVGFGGMRFVGSEEGRLVFVRVHELFPEDQLSPDRSHTMRLDPQWVATISVDGQPVWPARSPLPWKRAPKANRNGR